LPLKRNCDRAKKSLAPINQLKQYALSNYHYEKIHLHPGQCRAPSGVRAKDRNDRACSGKPNSRGYGGSTNYNNEPGGNNNHNYEPGGNNFAVADSLITAKPVHKFDLYG
jgi:hypothetical protein